MKEQEKDLARADTMGDSSDLVPRPSSVAVSATASPDQISPLPWRVARHNGVSVVSAKGVSVRYPINARANAEFIVRAVNHHWALVEALREVTEHMDRAGGDGYGMPECPWCRSQASDDGHHADCDLVKAREALKLAEATHV